MPNGNNQTIMMIVVVAALAAIVMIWGSLVARRHVKAASQAVADIRAAQPPGEVPAITMQLTKKRFFTERGYAVGVTPQHLYIGRLRRPVERIVRDASLDVTCKRRTWTDAGNTSIRSSSGWEIRIRRQGARKLKLRLYDYVIRAGGAEAAEAAAHFLHILEQPGQGITQSTYQG